MDYGWVGLGVVGIPIGEVFTWLDSCVSGWGVCAFFFTSPAVLFFSSLFTLFYFYPYFISRSVFKTLFIPTCLSAFMVCWHMPFLISTLP